MPAQLEDPLSPPLARAPRPSPPSIHPRTVTLRDRTTTATLIPFSSPARLPLSLLACLCAQMNREIDKGDTYPMTTPFALDRFGAYWFGEFGAVMLLGRWYGAENGGGGGGGGRGTEGGGDGGRRMETEIGGDGDAEADADADARLEETYAWLQERERAGVDWERVCLGSFYVKPNYPGRSSHVCNGGFLTTDAARNRGVGRLMGESYLEWAPKLGYTYSVFNLVYETNVASCRIWDALGFKRIGRIPQCGHLKSHPDAPVDALIYGRELTPPSAEDFLEEQRFEKIRFYLKHGRYPDGASRAEKSRLRSAASNYRLVVVGAGGEAVRAEDVGEGGHGAIDPVAAGGNAPGTVEEGEEKLFLKDKEVIPDSKRQYDVARRVHLEIEHGGINKTTAAIAERFHWVRIKETVSAVVKNCAECADTPRGGGAVSAAAGGTDVGGQSDAKNAPASQQLQARQMLDIPMGMEPPVESVFRGGVPGEGSSGEIFHSSPTSTQPENSTTTLASLISSSSSNTSGTPIHQPQDPTTASPFLPLAMFRTSHPLTHAGIIDYQVPVDPRLQLTQHLQQQAAAERFLESSAGQQHQQQRSGQGGEDQEMADSFDRDEEVLRSQLISAGFGAGGKAGNGKEK